MTYGLPFLARHLASLCLGREPKVKVATMVILLMAIMAILLMVIVVILLLVILLFTIVAILLLATGGYFIISYFINGYK